MTEAKAVAEKAQHDALMQAQLAKQQLKSVIGGGPTVTAQGCKCAQSCVAAGDNMMSGGHKWCITEGVCGSSMGDGRFFDICPTPTKKRCTCREEWMTRGHAVVGCTEERSRARPWCKVREVGCGKQNGDGAWWDYCKK